VTLGDVSPDDVAVELIAGPVGDHDELGALTITPMTRVDADPSGAARYEATFTCAATGRIGVTVRVVPFHPDLDSPAELGRMAWA
jgi:starch phosphorylase